MSSLPSASTKMCSWIADEIGAYVDRQVERGFRRSTLAEIENGSVFVLRSPLIWRVVPFRNSFLYLRLRVGIGSRLVDEVAALHVVQAVAHGGCVFPSVVLFSSYSSRRKTQPFLHVLRLVVVPPFQVVVYAQPLLLFPSCRHARKVPSVEHVGVRSHDEYGHIDVADAGYLVLPGRMLIAFRPPRRCLGLTYCWPFRPLIEWQRTASSLGNGAGQGN